MVAATGGRAAGLGTTTLAAAHAAARFAAGLLVLAILGAAATQPPADKPGRPAGESDPQSAVEPRSKPGAGQKFLERFLGEWTVEKSFHCGAAARRPGRPGPAGRR
jgi:hypothetical protein